MAQPNLLFIYTDEQAFNTLATYGNTQIQLPNLNRLVAESVVFEQAYVSQPVCTPSRSTLLTGLYPHENGCTENNVPLRSATRCLGGRRNGSHRCDGRQGRLRPVVLISAPPGRTHGELAVPILPPRWRCALQTPVSRCFTGRRDGGHLRDIRQAQPRPSSLRAGAVRLCGSYCPAATRCLSGRRDGGGPRSFQRSRIQPLLSRAKWASFRTWVLKSCFPLPHPLAPWAQPCSKHS